MKTQIKGLIFIPEMRRVGTALFLNHMTSSHMQRDVVGGCIPHVPRAISTPLLTLTHLFLLRLKTQIAFNLDEAHLGEASST